MLLALILRGVSFEYRRKRDNPKWRNAWDWAIFIGSFLPALLWGVAVANIIRGVPVDGEMNFVGTFWGLLNPFALLGGLMFLVVFLFHGAVYLALKTGDPVMSRAQATAKKMWIVALVLVVLFVVYAFAATGLYASGAAYLPTLIAAVALILAGVFLMKGRTGWAFAMTAVTIVFVTFTAFAGLYPNVLPSTLDPAYNLTIYNASASQYTLKIMTIVALIFTPLVLIYQGWTYYTFRQRLTLEHEMEY
jgi:cytochrome d ubiquinol oxidase subunit II